MAPKPIKRDKNILHLSKEHHFSLLFCWKIRQGIKKDVDVERIRRYVQYFWTRCLQQHFRTEEDFLFASSGGRMVQKALKEHARINKLVTHVLHFPASDTPKSLLALADAIDEHVRYEERELFPHLEKKLGRAELQHIGEHMPEEVLTDEYRDEFWNWPSTL